MGSKIIYQPFGKNREEIRLLDIHPASRLEDPLHCTLRHAKLSDATYSALSYVWGTDNVNKSPIAITYKRSGCQYLKSKLHLAPRLPLVQNVMTGRNLVAALKCMRQHNPAGLTIWADALCINQVDTKEKSRQVLLMTRIYSQAETVLAWLGPHPEDDTASVGHLNAAFNLAESVQAKVDRSVSFATEEQWLEACFTMANTTSLNPKQELNYSQRIGVDLAEKLRNLFISDASLHDGLEAIKLLSRTDYFSRIWILQETGRARALTFYHANRHISYRPVFLLLCLAHYLRTLPDVPKIQTILRDLDTRFLGCLTARMICTRGALLRDVLGVAYLASIPLHHATKPEDLIYGRLGLAKDPSGIHVDYDLSVPHVYTHAARFLLTHGFTTPLTVFKPYKYMCSPYSEALPSWAHDWTKKGLDIFDKFQASKDIEPDVTFIPFSYPKFPQALRMTGISIGHIATIGRPFSVIANEAGFSNVVVADSSARTASTRLSETKKASLTAKIHHASRLLGTSTSSADMITIFNEPNYPLASFWCWWLTWVAELQTLAAPLPPSSPTSSSSNNDILELLFREALRILERDPSARPFSDTTHVHALLEFPRWRTLLYPSAAPVTADGVPADAGMTAFGIQVVESFFRSAWGMRAARLRSGRVAYVPEYAALGDDVVVLYGVKAPLVLRRRTGTGPEAAEIVGPAHVCGVMEGEVMDLGLTAKPYVLI